jgi:ABC-type lipoprotein release transport system permease subunit
MTFGSTVAPVQIWSGAEVRRRWKGLLLLGALAGVAAGLTVAAVDGAARTSTSYQRMRSQLNASDAVFFPSQVGFYDADISKLGQMPEVAAYAGFALTDSHLDGFPPDDSPLVTVGDSWFHQIEGAKIIAGRLPDPNRDDEAVITAEAEAQGAHLGQVLVWRNATPQDVKALGGPPGPDFDWKTAHGPVTDLKIVGVIRLPMESVLSFASSGLLLPSPKWAQLHLADTSVDFTNAIVRLKDGARDIPAFTADVAKAYGRDDIPIKDLSDDVKRVQESVDLERTALLLFAAAVAAAGLVLVGQAFVRSVHAGADAVPVLSAMGLSRGGLVSGLTLPHGLTAISAGIVTVVTAVAVSTRFPIGLARELDPDLGVHVDAVDLAVGVAAVLVITIGAAALIGWLSVRSASRRRGRLRVLGAATKAGAPLPAAVGASLALERTPGRGAAPVRPALLGAIVGVLAVVAAVTLVGGIDDALHQPERTGRTWDLEAETADDSVPTAAQLSAVRAQSDVTGIGLMARVASTVGGKDAPLYSLESLEGPMHFVLLSGRAPESADELAIGPRTAKLLHVSVGQEIKAGATSTPMKVVGVTLLAQTPHTSFDEGALVTPAGLDRAIGGSAAHEDEIVLVRLRPGADSDKVSAALGAAGLGASTPTMVPDVTNLATVRTLPLYLAAFLALLAIGAIAHALLSVSRARSRDLAVLRALGMTPRQAGACIMWQAAIIGAFALAIGLPLGVVIGRQIWHLMTNTLSFVYVGPASVALLLLMAPAALAALALLAIYPAHRAAHLRPAAALRAE